MDLSKLIHEFVKVVTWISCPLPKKTEVWSRFESFLKLLLWSKGAFGLLVCISFISMTSISAFSNITIHPDHLCILHHYGTKSPVRGKRTSMQVCPHFFPRIFSPICTYPWCQMQLRTLQTTFKTFYFQVSLVYIHCNFLHNLEHFASVFLVCDYFLFQAD